MAETAQKDTFLITGGLGYIGSHTVVELLRRQYRVVVLDNLSNSTEAVLGRIESISGRRPEFYQVDLCDATALNSVFEKERNIKAVIHFAALKAVGESVEKPLLYYKNNLISLIHLLEAMQNTGVLNLVFSSSCTVYGEPDQLPVTEQSAIKPAISPYGNTKQVGEEILRDACANGTIRAISLRYFNPVGAHFSGKLGELPLGKPNNLVPLITQTAAGVFPYLRIFGDDYNTADGTCIRDYIHVEDVAAAHVAACDRLLSLHGEAYEVYNIGTGTGYSVMEVVRTFEEVSGQKLPFKIEARRPGDIEKVFADTTLSNRILNWKANKTLNEMMHSAWIWQQTLMNTPSS